MYNRFKSTYVAFLQNAKTLITPAPLPLYAEPSDNLYALMVIIPSVDTLVELIIIVLASDN